MSDELSLSILLGKQSDTVQQNKCVTIVIQIDSVTTYISEIMSKLSSLESM